MGTRVINAAGTYSLDDNEHVIVVGDPANIKLIGPRTATVEIYVQTTLHTYGALTINSSHPLSRIYLHNETKGLLDAGTVVVSDTAYAAVHGGSNADVKNSGRVDAYNTAKVTASDDSYVSSYDMTTVTVDNSLAAHVTVEASGSSRVHSHSIYTNAILKNRASAVGEFAELLLFGRSRYVEGRFVETLNISDHATITNVPEVVGSLSYYSKDDILQNYGDTAFQPQSGGTESQETTPDDETTPGEAPTDGVNDADAAETAPAVENTPTVAAETTAETVASESVPEETTDTTDNDSDSIAVDVPQLDIGDEEQTPPTHVIEDDDEADIDYSPRHASVDLDDDWSTSVVRKDPKGLDDAPVASAPTPAPTSEAPPEKKKTGGPDFSRFK